MDRIAIAKAEVSEASRRMMAEFERENERCRSLFSSVISEQIPAASLAFSGQGVLAHVELAQRHVMLLFGLRSALSTTLDALNDPQATSADKFDLYRDFSKTASGLFASWPKDSGLATMKSGPWAMFSNETDEERLEHARRLAYDYKLSLRFMSVQLPSPAEIALAEPVVDLWLDRRDDALADLVSMLEEQYIYLADWGPILSALSLDAGWRHTRLLGPWLPFISDREVFWARAYLGSDYTLADLRIAVIGPTGQYIRTNDGWCQLPDISENDFSEIQHYIDLALISQGYSVVDIRVGVEATIERIESHFP